jgi:hypothetical protein
MSCSILRWIIPRIDSAVSLRSTTTAQQAATAPSALETGPLGPQVPKQIHHEQRTSLGLGMNQRSELAGKVVPGNSASMNSATSLAVRKSSEPRDRYHAPADRASAVGERMPRCQELGRTHRRKDHHAHRAESCR